MRMTLIVGSLLLIGLLCALMASTTQQPTPNPRPAAQQPTAGQLAEMKKQIESLSGRVTVLEAANTGLRTRLFTVEVAQNANQSATLDLTSHQFQRLDSSTGTFLVLVQDAIPYLDGYKIILKIGNTSSAKFSGFKLKVKWNRKYDFEKYTADSYSQWNKEMHDRELSFVEDLKPGAWNKVTLVLPSTTNNQLGYFLISIETDSISLIDGSN